MSKRAKVSPWMMPMLLLSGLLMLLAAFLVGKELHRRGTFVDDSLYAEEISTAAGRAGVDPQLVRAVIFQESRFRRDAIGRKGEVGLMQVMPGSSVSDWAKAQGRQTPTQAELMQIRLNLEVGTWYLARALKRWEGYKDQVALALIQYNAGESRAEKWKPENKDDSVTGRIKIRSTAFYVEQITARSAGYLQQK